MGKSSIVDWGTCRLSKGKSEQWIAAVARERARRIRGLLGIGLDPIQDVTSLLEQSGALVAKKPTVDELSGFFFRAGRQSMVFINSAKSFGHQQFTAAHELHHHFFDENIDYSINRSDWSEHKGVEARADWFAAELLMPGDALIADWRALGLHTRSVTESDVVRLQHKWCVSYASMCYRLYLLGMISQRQYDTLKQASSRRIALELGYLPELCDPTNETYVSRRYIEYALKAYQEDMISEAKLRQVLALVGKDLTDVGLDDL